MKVIKVADIEVKEATSKMFVGQVYRQPFLDEETAQEMRVAIVTFSPGARNLLHTHTGEQVLYVVYGEGIIATEKEEFVIKPGTLAYIPPGEKHWHGASKDSWFSHITIVTPGQTNF